MRQRKLQRRGFEVHVMFRADRLEPPDFVLNVLGRDAIVITRVGTRSRCQDSRGIRRTYDDRDVLLDAALQSIRQRRLVEQRVWHGADDEVELKDWSDGLERSRRVESHADCLDLTTALQFFKRPDAG